MTRRSGSVKNLTMVMIFLTSCLVTRSTGSAIPMWEFLGKEEKISHLYKVFTEEVARYCSDSSSPDCNKNLLIAGVKNLLNMDENELDRMDPYQRDAHYIIWRAIVRDSRLPVKYGHEDVYNTNENDPLATSESDDNGLGEASMTINDYVRPSDHSGPYLVGPMVIRVFPDGSPVPEDSKRPLPRDEDAEDLKYSKVPSISEIEANNHGSLYVRPNYADSLNVPKNLNVYVPENPIQRPNQMQNSKNFHYRRLNFIFQDRRVPEISKNTRNVRFY